MANYTPISEIIKKALTEMNSSEEIINDNIVDWDETSIYNEEPGSFEAQELTDGDPLNKHLEDIPTKQDKEHEEDGTAEVQVVQVDAQLHEATMADIPHEIDDGIHELGNMRHDLEQTKKNWDLSGIEIEPLDDLLAGIDDLVNKFYKNGAAIADDQLATAEEEKADEESDEKTDEKIEEE